MGLFRKKRKNEDVYEVSSLKVETEFDYTKHDFF